MMNGTFVNMDRSHRASQTMTSLHIMVQINVSNTISVAFLTNVASLSFLEDPVSVHIPTVSNS